MYFQKLGLVRKHPRNPVLTGADVPYGSELIYYSPEVFRALWQKSDSLSGDYSPEKS